MINQIIKIKLEKYFEAEKVNHPISSILSFYDILNILYAVKGKKIKFICGNKEGFNRMWKDLHARIPVLIFGETIKTILGKWGSNPFYSPSEEELKEAFKKTNTEEFNKIFKILFSSNIYSLKSQNNINQTIKNLFPDIIKYLNQIPPEKYVDKENLRGDIGVSTYNI